MWPCLSFQGEKTRQDLLNEIIAKSKERKLEKARGKEEQESERERLDEGMDELLDMLSQRPTKSAGKTQSDDYDLTMRVRESIEPPPRTDSRHHPAPGVLGTYTVRVTCFTKLDPWLALFLVTVFVFLLTGEARVTQSVRRRGLTCSHDVLSVRAARPAWVCLGI